MRAWARQRSPVEWLAIAAGLAVFGYLAWDRALWDSRLQLILHLLAAGAIGGLVIHASRRGELPRTRVDLPILGLVAAFALATVFAVNLGMSLRALAAIIASALMLPVALVALRARPTWTANLVCLPVLVLAAIALGGMLGRRAAWLVVGAPGLPPLRLLDEGTAFGSVAVAPFILLGTWVIAGVITDRPWRRTVRSSIIALGLPLAVLSGSRSAWVAIGVTAAVLTVPIIWRRRRRILDAAHLSGRRLGRLAAILVGLPVLLLIVAPRLTAMSSLLYRESLWQDTINAWSASPVTGLGPGIMPWAREAAASDLSFPVSQPHSHNLALGVLGDAGLVGLAAAIVLVATVLVVAGPWRSRTSTGRAASAALIGIGISG
ncbi:MAG: O-antigen ligase family protein, partial [Candidatus Limnocylindria bacterium]